MIKEILIRIALYILANAIIFFMFSYVLWNINPLEWGLGTRIFHAVLVFYLTWFLCMPGKIIS